MKRILAFSVLLAVLLFTGDFVFADDIDILGEVGVNVKPNLVMILDNSFSMVKTIEGPVGEYSKDINYYKIAFLTDKGEREDGLYYFDADKIYSSLPSLIEIKPLASTGLLLFPVVPAMRLLLADEKNPSEISDTALKNKILTEGHASKTSLGFTTYYYHGNYLNWFYETRLNLALRTIEKLMKERYGDINFALMSFNEMQDGGHFDMKIDDCVNPACFVDKLKSIGQCLTPHTPLAETLAESGRYFSGKNGRFTSGTYISPIKYWCQKNYVMVLTDGSAVFDSDWSFWWPWSPDRMKDTGAIGYLDDVAAYMFENDMMPGLGEDGTGKEKQNVRTYCVGFKFNNLLDNVTKRRDNLKSAAARGGGRYLEMNSTTDIDKQLDAIMNNILNEGSGFGGISAPVSPDDRSYTGPYAYMSMFKAVSDEGRWIGNIKKFSISDEGSISTKDEWSENDSSDVETGGARSKLLEMQTQERKIYTSKNASSTLVEFKNESFSSSELAAYNLTPDLISNIRCGGQCADGKPGMFVLGDIIHSIPLLYRYGTAGTPARIFSGSNDGMLHCFDENTGNEKWAFIPESQMAKLKLLTPAAYGAAGVLKHNYYVDGGKAVYEGASKNILIFGERRGGKNYYGLDITSPDAPKLEYTVNINNDFGQSWSNPRVVPVIESSLKKDVFWIGGGYDAENQDKYKKDDESVKPAEADNLGKGVYAVSAETGQIIITPDKSGINNCIIDPASFTPGYSGSVAADGLSLSDREEAHSRLYACDMGGNLWGFRQDADKISTVENIVTHQPGDRIGPWKKYSVFSSGSVQKKIFHRPEVVLEIFDKKTVDPETGKVTVDRYNGEYVYFGTGDREHPAAKPTNNDPSNQNRFYAVKNCWDTETAVGESGLMDVTAYPASDTSDLVSYDRRGWYVRMENSGEKIVSHPLAYRGMVFFTTYTPADGADHSTEAGKDPCSGSNKLGKARLYVLNYKTGEPVLNLSRKGLGVDGNETEDAALIKKLCKDDRVKEIGDGMPGSPSLTFPKNGGSKIMVGVGNKAFTQELGVRDMTVYYWRENL